MDFNTDLQPGDRFARRLREVHARGAARRATAASTRPSSATTAACCAQFASRRRADKPGYYDEQGRSLRRFFLRVAAQVRAAHHVAILTRAGLHPVLHTAARPSRRRLRRARGAPVVAAAAGTSPPRLRRQPTAAWCGCATQSGYESLLPALVGLRHRHPRRRPRRVRATRSARSALPGWPPGRTSHYGLHTERRCS